MDLATKPDLRISGSGSSGGGEFGVVSISGSGRIEGPLVAEKLTVSGAANINGGVTATETRVSGSGKVEGDLTASALHVSGSLSVAKDATVGTGSVSGSLRVNGDLMVENLTASGMVDVDGDIKADTLKSSVLRCHKDVECGHIEMCGGLVDGLLNAETIDIKLGGPLKCREIGCRRLTVRPLKVIGWFHSKELECEQIEGDQLELYRTRCKIVRGDVVVVGKGCRIERVEYRHRIDIDADAQVVESVQLS